MAVQKTGEQLSTAPAVPVSPSPGFWQHSPARGCAVEQVTEMIQAKNNLPGNKTVLPDCFQRCGVLRWNFLLGLAVQEVSGLVVAVLPSRTFVNVSLIKWPPDDPQDVRG